MDKHQLAEAIRADAIHNRGATGKLREHVVTIGDGHLLEIFFGCPLCETIDDEDTIERVIGQVDSLEEFLEITQTYHEAHAATCPARSRF